MTPTGVVSETEPCLGSGGVFKGTSDIALLKKSESVSGAILRSARLFVLAHHGWHRLYVC